MHIQPHCITCLIGQMERAYLKFCPLATPPEIVQFQKLVMNKMVQCNSNFTPYYSQLAYHTLNQELKQFDPYREIKSYYNHTVEHFVPKLLQKINLSPDPVFMAITLAILGNTIDFASNHEIDLEKELENFSLDQLVINDYSDFVKTLEESKTILIIGDNAGEIVLDRILISTLKAKYPEKRIIYAVRGGPMINDVTITDAAEVGLPSVCEVIEGNQCPGIIFEETTARFKEIYSQEADLIIAKGQGNFESLDDDENTKAPIYFCLKLKCEVSAQAFKKSLGSLVFCNRNHFNKRIKK